VLALGGAFWLGLAIGMVAPQSHWFVPAAGSVVQLAATVGLIWAAVRLKRRSGFHRSELRRLEGDAEAQRRKIIRWMVWTGVAQAVLAGTLVWMCVTLKAEHLMWAAIGAVVSLHFAPLGTLFHVRAYHVIAIVGTIVSAAGVAVSRTPVGVAALGIGMATLMWGAGVYVLWNADRIADRACAERWTA
jgi:hypothetical protein